MIFEVEVRGTGEVGGELAKRKQRVEGTNVGRHQRWANSLGTRIRST